MAKVLISYYSRSGNTEAMAKVLAEALEAEGAKVALKRAEETTPADLVAADAVALGSPDYFSYVAGQVKIIFDEALAVKPKLAGKPAVSFASHGGGGKISGPFDALMKSIGLSLVAPCVLAKQAPDGEAVQEIKAAAKALSVAVKK